MIFWIFVFHSGYDTGLNLARGVSGCLVDTLIPIGFVYNAMGWKELDIQFTPDVYFWTPSSETLAKALVWHQFHLVSFSFLHFSFYFFLLLFFSLLFLFPSFLFLFLFLCFSFSFFSFLFFFFIFCFLLCSSLLFSFPPPPLFCSLLWCVWVGIKRGGGVGGDCIEATTESFESHSLKCKMWVCKCKTTMNTNASWPMNVLLFREGYLLDQCPSSTNHWMIFYGAWPRKQLAQCHCYNTITLGEFDNVLISACNKI